MIKINTENIPFWSNPNLTKQGTFIKYNSYTDQVFEIRYGNIILSTKLFYHSRWEYKGTGVWGHSGSLEKPSPPAPPLRQISSVSAVSSSKRSEISFGGASTATQELDDLMMSLNSFRYELTFE